MPVSVPVLAAFSIEGGDLLVLGRLYVENLSTHNLGFAVQGDVSSVSRTIVSLADGTTVLSGPTALTVGSVILATPSTGNVWRVDNIGFNVRDQVPGALLNVTPGVELQYTFTMTSTTVVKLAVQVDLRPSN